VEEVKDQFWQKWVRDIIVASIRETVAGPRPFTRLQGIKTSHMILQYSYLSIALSTSFFVRTISLKLIIPLHKGFSDVSLKAPIV